MANIRLPRALCAIVGEVISTTGSHQTLNALFESAGAPGEPPELSHATKWKEWLFRAGTDSETDSLEVLGNVIEEFMDLTPNEFSDTYDDWVRNRARIVDALEENGFRYFQGGRILPNNDHVYGGIEADSASTKSDVAPHVPSDVEDLLLVLIRGLRRAMHPLTHRRKDAQPLRFTSEYDVQDLLHALLRPWVADIRPEEFTPSYAGSSTRMDFLLPDHGIVIELKFVRDRNHAKKIGDELIIDVEHYRRHPGCQTLWCVIYDQDSLLTNAEGLKNDLEGERKFSDGIMLTKVFVL